ncbi:DUF3445 domain-containing protein [Leptolyngbya sp. FACHB-321]|uniref:heme-dependent oxidative N-demethylase family protein n=1 Tax=Leptolyngbya sp. FACHB-321 TaxID=2692807 RepID=UPI00168230EA|nr:DUF3445 domain-containing protein [Leptolyngbya sp. FACHB-321]MBD2037797.1 DUF3445 domain-containing protein [Leptolyngbya sp. FACHB-321]
MAFSTDRLLQGAPPVEVCNDSAYYFPLVHGRYEVKPGLVKFGTDFGNEAVDRQVFQFDSSFAHYRQMKRQARAEQLSKYYQTHNYTDAVASAIARFIVHRLVQEHPQHFQLTSQTGGTLSVYSQLTGEIFYLNAAYRLQQVQAVEPIEPPYVSTLDALASQLQDDITVVSRSNDDHWISAIHLCYPNHWSAEAKIGREFATVHAPVAGMTAMNQRGKAIVQTMITRKPSVRFAWGLSTDTRLNHHPVPPAGVAIDTWQGRAFNPQQPQLYLRIERQVVWGFPDCDAALFTIRTYFRDCHAIKQDPRLNASLVSALQSMPSNSLVYKGLDVSREAIVAWLTQEP